MSQRLSRVVGNYETMLRLGVNGPLTKTQLEKRVARYGMAAANQEWLLNSVRQVLCSAGVPPMLFAAYHAFSREVDKLSRQVTSAESKAATMVAIADKWTIRGLSRPVLLDIAATVFNLSPPGAPGEPSQVQGQ